MRRPGSKDPNRPEQIFPKVVSRVLVITLDSSVNWCDNDLRSISSKHLNKNVILIPLCPSSAHYAGVYLQVKAVYGGSCDHFEDKRTAGHYQSLIQKSDTTWFSHTLNGGQVI